VFVAPVNDRHRPILPRSLHLPVAVVDGSLIENTNKTGVRLWTDPSFDEGRKIGYSDALDFDRAPSGSPDSIQSAGRV
jgi:hypothetical protein